jgi:hypothetical protein
MFYCRKEHDATMTVLPLKRLPYKRQSMYASSELVLSSYFFNNIVDYRRCKIKLAIRIVKIRNNVSSAESILTTMRVHTKHLDGKYYQLGLTVI